MNNITFKINNIIGTGIIISYPDKDCNYYEVKTTSNCGKFKAGNVIYVYLDEIVNNPWHPHPIILDCHHYMKNNIVKGSIVKYKQGWQRVTAVIGNTVNLGNIFGGKINHKRVPLNEVVEDEAAWYKNWQQSETYQSM